MPASNPGTADSPLEAVGSAVGPHVTDTFVLLGNGTRLAILLALWDAYDPYATTNALTFTDLRNRVGVRQGGQFNYHLDKLVGEFVRKTDDGYALKPTGLTFVQSIIAGAGLTDPSADPTPIDAACPHCAATTAITYRDGRVVQVCTECPGEAGPTDELPDGALVAWTFDPTGLAGRTAEELFAASTVRNYARIAQRFEGICPDCSGTVEWSFDVCDGHEAGPDEPCSQCGRESPVLARETCTVCKSRGWGSPAIKVLFHPAVISFYYDHGVDLGFTGTTEYTDVVRTLQLVDDFEVTVEAADPLRVCIAMTADGDELRLVLDDEMAVVDVRDHR